MSNNNIRMNANSKITIQTPSGKKEVTIDKNGKAIVKPLLGGSGQSRNIEVRPKEIVLRKKVGKPKMISIPIPRNFEVPVPHNELGKRPPHPKKNKKRNKKKDRKHGRNQIRERLYQQGFSKSKIRRLTGSGDYQEEGWMDTIEKWAPQVWSVAKHLIPMLFGAGDYEMGPKEEVMTNTLLAECTEGKLGNQVPIMGDSKHCNIMCHREYLGDILSTTQEFVNTTFLLNPGLDETMPWLSYIANQFEQWKPLGMIVEIVTEASDYTDAVGLGFVAMATQYNTQSAAFADKKSLLNHQMAVSGKPSVNLVHPIECKPSDNVLAELYTRSGTPPADADVRFYDLGRLNVAVGGQTADNVKIGELWISYQIALYTPKSSQVIGNIVMYDHFPLVAVDGPNPMGTQANPSSMPFSNLGGTVSGANRTYTFPRGTRGRFLYLFTAVGTSQSIVNPQLTLTGCAAVSNQFFVNGSVFGTANGTTSTTFVKIFFVDVTADTAVITWPNTGTLPTVSAGDLIVIQAPKGYNFPNSGFKHVLDGRPDFKPKYPQSDIERILERIGNLHPQTMKTVAPRVLDKCIYCKVEKPDHLGRDCPLKHKIWDQEIEDQRVKQEGGDPSESSDYDTSEEDTDMSEEEYKAYSEWLREKEKRKHEKHMFQDHPESFQKTLKEFRKEEQKNTDQWYEGLPPEIRNDLILTKHLTKDQRDFIQKKISNYVQKNSEIKKAPTPTPEQGECINK